MKNGDGSPESNILSKYLCRLPIHSIAKPVASVVVDFEAMDFATMPLDLRHEFLFTVAAHLPIALGGHSRAGSVSCLVPIGTRYTPKNFPNFQPPEPQTGRSPRPLCAPNRAGKTGFFDTPKAARCAYAVRSASAASRRGVRLRHLS